MTRNSAVKFGMHHPFVQRISETLKNHLCCCAKRLIKNERYDVTLNKRTINMCFHPNDILRIQNEETLYKLVKKKQNT